MKNNKTIISILIILPLLTGCWGIRIDADTPSEYTDKKSNIASLYGSTREEILGVFGEPKSIVRRDISTYYVYEWRRTDRDLLLLLPFPIGNYASQYKWYCLLLEFDQDNHLIHHETATDATDNLGAAGKLILNPMKIPERNCISIFEAPTKRLKNEIGVYCPNAELGHADAQKRIADIYYHGEYNVERDLYRAYVWYSLAKAKGDIDASILLNWVTDLMSHDQVLEAQQLLEQWEPGNCRTDLLERHRELIKEE